MPRPRLLKTLLTPVTLVAALAAPLVGAAPSAWAATCRPDPLNGALRTPDVLHSRDRRRQARRPEDPEDRQHHPLPVQRHHRRGHLPGQQRRYRRRLDQHHLGRPRGRRLVYDAYLSTPALGSDGYSPGIRHCGTPANPIPVFAPSAYPWPTQDSWVSDGHGYYQGECVSFAAWALRTDGRAHTKLADFQGNASAWTGAYTDPTPQVGDIAQWDPYVNGAGSAGHVAYVTAVNTTAPSPSTSTNWGTFHRLNIRTITASTPRRYLHF